MERFGSFTVLVVVLQLLLAYTSASVLRPGTGTGISFAEDSCAGRCNQTGTIPGAPCQCNKPCERFGDCCSDYADLCQISDTVLENLAEELVRLDVTNNATAYIQVDIQGRARSGQDMAPENLLTVSPEAFTRSTIAKLYKLHDNYNARVSVTERFTPEQVAEMDDFIDAILSTPVMQRAQEFLREKNLPNGRDSFYELWFQLYNRGGQTNSSSGFEHVFIGELNNGVSGFHNWESFTWEESARTMDYLGYYDYIDFGPTGSVIEHTFDWSNQNKEISSMFIGFSPELELALFTVCFHARQDAKCPVSINGNKIKIQTYTLKSANGVHVGTSYPDLSDNEGRMAALRTIKKL